MSVYKIHPIVMGTKVFDKVKEMARILIPLHEPKFASMDTVDP